MTVEIRKGYDSKTLLLKNFYFIKVFLRSESPNITTIQGASKLCHNKLASSLKWCVMSKI